MDISCNDDVIAYIAVDGPEITDQPDDQLDIIQGMNATFTVAASGLTLTYQWFKDGVSISDTADTYTGTQSETLTVLSVMEPKDNGTFTVTVTNPTSSVTSVPAAILTVCEFETILKVPFLPIFLFSLSVYSGSSNY